MSLSPSRGTLSTATGALAYRTAVSTALTAATQIADNSAFSTLGRGPAAVYDAYSHKTFICFLGPSRDCYATFFDHRTGTVATPVLVGSQIIAPSSTTGTPSLAIDFDGRICIAFGNSDNGAQYARSTVGRSIDAWTVSTVPFDGAFDFLRYDPVTRAMLLFQRSGSAHGDTFPSHEYVEVAITADHGATWTHLPIIDTTGSPDALSECYVWDAKFRNGRWWLAWTVARGAVHSANRQDVYLAGWSPASQTWTDVAGNDLGAVIDWTDHATCTVASAGSADGAEAGIVRVDWHPATGRPWVAWCDGGDLVPTVSEWTGTSWQAHPIPQAMDYLFGFFDLRFRRTGQLDFFVPAIRLGGDTVSRMQRFTFTEGAWASPVNVAVGGDPATAGVERVIVPTNATDGFGLIFQDNRGDRLGGSPTVSTDITSLYGAPAGLDIGAAALIPDAPASLTLTPSTTQVAASWAAVSGATGYRLRRGGTLVFEGTATDFTDTTVTPGTSYTFSVAAFNDSAEGPAITVDTTTPALGQMFTDDFNRADDPTSAGPDWTETQANGNFVISANQFGLDATVTSTYWAQCQAITLDTPDQYSQVDVTVAPGGASTQHPKVCVRMQRNSGTDHRNIYFQWAPGHGAFELQKFHGSSSTLLASLADTAPTLPYTARIEIENNVITCTVDGVEKIVYDFSGDADVAEYANYRRVGMGLRRTSSADLSQRVDNYAGGDLVATTAAAPLTWSPPALISPTIINVTGSTRVLSLSPEVDYDIRLPATAHTISSDFQIVGGNNVKMIGGEILCTSPGRFFAVFGDRNRATEPSTPRTVHIEGVRFTAAPGVQMTEGINVDVRDEDATTVRFQNCIMAKVYGSYTTNHADIIQCFNGPQQLQIDGFVGETNYQGLFWQPYQFGNGPYLQNTYRRMWLKGDETSAGLLYYASSRTYPEPVIDRVYLTPNPGKSYPDQVIYGDIKQYAVPVVVVLTPTQSPDVTLLTGDPGVNYVSPGYLS